jgi:hypothetical protein
MAVDGFELAYDRTGSGPTVHWSGPDFTLAEEYLDHLVSVYGSPGAFTASVQWYQAGAGTAAVAVSETAPAAEDRLATPAVVLWPVARA